MNFTVTWELDARSELHQVWATAPNPAAVDTAERLLGIDPFGNGQHITEGLWRAVVPPLVLYYAIDLTRPSVAISNVAHTV